MNIRPRRPEARYIPREQLEREQPDHPLLKPAAPSADYLAGQQAAVDLMRILVESPATSQALRQALDGVLKTGRPETLLAFCDCLQERLTPRLPFGTGSVYDR